MPDKGESVDYKLYCMQEVMTEQKISDNGVDNDQSEIVLYHGSIGGIQGNINVNYSDNLCDFGRGFYLGDNENQARSRICNNAGGVLYTFKLFKAEARIYQFTDDVIWALYIARNRQKIDFSSYQKLIDIFNMIDSYDIVAGFIADDKMANVYNNFINGNTTSKVLSESLKLVKYGRQFVIKNQKYCSDKYLCETSNVHPSLEQRNAALNWGRQVKESMNSDLEKIRQTYRRDGKYLDEIIKEYE